MDDKLKERDNSGMSKVASGNSLHVSFPDSRPFGYPGQTDNPSRITPSGTKSEKLSFFHNAKQNGQTKSIDLSDGPTMLDEMDRPSQLDL